jgi:LAO/AO transport system kinase
VSATVLQYAQQILNGDRVALSRAITLVESSLPEHTRQAQEIIEQLLPHSGNSIRIGITGVPGVGKSTFIDVFGSYVADKGKQVAVLAIDPSSTISKGSILGDKTRMENLVNHPNAYIRPTASGSALGGVAKTTGESILLCEAAGFDVVIVETVGVGQSETTVKNLTDFFLLLMLAGAGDELQGMKRGIMEMADLLLINKADGDNLDKAQKAAQQYRQALHLFPATDNGWIPKADICSAYTKEGIDRCWQAIEQFVAEQKANNFFQQNRQQQQLYAFRETLQQQLLQYLLHRPETQHLIKAAEADILKQHISSYNAAQQVAAAILKR